MKPKKHASSHRVLIVEDHAILAEATAEFLQNYGLEVRIASTGNEAIEVASAFLPEIVLCDMRLPDMGGADVARALRALPGLENIVIAIHTAWEESQLRATGVEMDAVDLILSKPIDAKKLETLLSVFRDQIKRTA
jgi:CheY-like chemotaxis protein